VVTPRDRNDNEPRYRLWVNEERTVLVELWLDTETLTVARRDHPSDTWGPPVTLNEEPVT
jgi:hypothetical protein